MIFPNSPAASTIPPVELEKRVNSFNQRRTLIRSNPSLYVSKTRLSIRQIPVFVTERCLRHLAVHSIKEFDAEAKRGERQGLSEDEMLEDDGHEQKLMDSLTGEEVNIPRHERKAESGKPSKAKLGKVKQAKVVRLAERVDPLTGKGKSKGYGFLELHRHSDALKVLRWANNNPQVEQLCRQWWYEELQDLLSTLKKDKTQDETTVGRIKKIKEAIEARSDKETTSKKTLIVEFSVENILIIKKRAGKEMDVFEKVSVLSGDSKSC